MSARRRLASRIAGVLAMTASLSTLAAVAWSDLAEASRAPAPGLEADELAAPRPVTLKRFEYKPSAEDELLEQLERSAIKRKAFGRFEGY
jgi:hypothetical protein